MSEEVKESKLSQEAGLSDSAKLLKQLHDEILKSIKRHDMIAKMSLSALLKDDVYLRPR
jgi:hypothetical protein